MADIEILVPFLQTDLVADGAIDEKVEPSRGRELLRQNVAGLESSLLAEGGQTIPFRVVGRVEPAGLGTEERGTLVTQIGRRHFRHG